MHLRDVLDPVDVFRKVLHLDLQELTTSCCAGAGPWAPDRPAVHAAAYSLLPPVRGPAADELVARPRSGHGRERSAEFQPGALRRLRQVAPGRPYVTVLTDLADSRRVSGWNASRSISSAARTRGGAGAGDGPPEERIFLTSGMILQPSFYDLAPVDRVKERLN